MMIDSKFLNRMFDYNQETGELTRAIKHGNQMKGATVGSVAIRDGKRYLQVMVNFKKMYVHRVIWIMVYGINPETVDHINGNSSDNRLCNLRSVSNLEQQRNLRRSSNNKSGVTGVHWCNTECKWVSRITVNRKTIKLAWEDDFFEAVCARKSAERRYGFHKNHGSDRPL